MRCGCVCFGSVQLFRHKIGRFKFKIGYGSDEKRTQGLFRQRRQGNSGQHRNQIAKNQRQNRPIIICLIKSGPFLNLGNAIIT